MIERRMKKREEKNGMKKQRRKIPSVLRHQNFQHVKSILHSCLVSRFLGIERKLFQVFQLTPSKRKGLKYFSFGSSALFINAMAAYGM